MITSEFLLAPFLPDTSFCPVLPALMRLRVCDQSPAVNQETGVG